jgi:hypothetical protein
MKYKLVVKPKAEQDAMDAAVLHTFRNPQIWKKR